ncbi:Helitron helicase [Phytophthora megakarya]|uniref:Helitron helicase n=1 Tax=Phytophthora megakarya TaxID=4795 RepID=A0A225WAT0_9STRA|nr:Helitron helicase [Phytophthora megakarya]
MLHDPCGQQNPNCLCMKNGKCWKKFPNTFSDETVVVEDKSSYIYKYVYKGSDRYISPIDKSNFHTQGSYHSVVNLPIHLESMSMVTYRAQATIPQLQILIRREAQTQLTTVFNL